MIWVYVLTGFFAVLLIMDWLGIANDNILVAALLGGVLGYGIDRLVFEVKKIAQPPLSAPYRHLTRNPRRQNHPKTMIKRIRRGLH
jgi:hypothetical protein